MKLQRNKRGYFRLRTLPVNIVYKALLDKIEYLNFPSGEKVSITSSRVRTFTKGVACVACGREGHYFAVEKQREQDPWHLNLYHVGKDGVEIMMTSDHIVAKVKGGSNSLKNRQPMCAPCNGKKGSYSSIEEATSAKHKYRLKVSIPKKIIKVRESIIFCERQLAKGDTSRDWTFCINRHKSSIQECERKLVNLEAEVNRSSINQERKVA